MFKEKQTYETNFLVPNCEKGLRIERNDWGMKVHNTY